METKAKSDPIKRLRESRFVLTCCNSLTYEYASAQDLADDIEAAYIKLPVAADGLPIRPGDLLDDSGEYPEKGRVESIRLDDDGDWMVTFHDSGGWCNVDMHTFRHVSFDTIEDVLYDLMNETYDWCHHTVPGDRTQSEIIADYACRIRGIVD